MRARRLIPVLGLTAVLTSCAPPSVLDAGQRATPQRVTDWGCADGRSIRTTESTPGALLTMRTATGSVTMRPEPATVGQRWVGGGVSFWVRGPDALLAANAAAPPLVVPCRDLAAPDARPRLPLDGLPPADA